MSIDRKYTEEEILDGIKRNEIAIIEHFYSSCFRQIRHLVISNSGGEEDAKDVFQEALVVLFRKIKDPEFSLSSTISTYVYSIARLIWLKELQSKSRQSINLKDTMDELLEQDHGIVELIERNDKLRLYREKFEELSEDCKRIIHMSLNNIPIKEITRVMGFSSEQHTKNRQFRCRKSLVQRIRKSLNYKELGNEEYLGN